MDIEGSEELAPKIIDDISSRRPSDATFIAAIIGIIIVLLLAAAGTFYFFSDRIIILLSQNETPSEVKDAAMQEAKNRSASEDRPRLTREEKTQFISLFDSGLNDIGVAETEENSVQGAFRLITASCTVSPRLQTENLSATWTVTVDGGEDYSYSWTGTDGLVGDTQTIVKKYTTTGTKTAQVTVTSPGAKNSPLVLPCAQNVRVQSFESY
jgi:hypothetical protein